MFIRLLGLLQILCAGDFEICNLLNIGMLNIMFFVDLLPF